MNKIKWQIHAETSVTQIMLWALVAHTFNEKWLWYVAWFFIIGNFYTAIKSTVKMGNKYFEEE